MMRFAGSHIAIAALIGVGAAGCSENEAQAGEGVGTPPTATVSPVAGAANESMISIRGDVVSSTPSSFVLDHGNGQVTVEMDDWDWFKEGQAIKPGENVFVTGRLDRDLLEQKKIEASTVYAVHLGSYFYASSVDEEDFPLRPPALLPLGTSDIVGSVKSIEGRELTIGHEGSTLRVDTAQMADNPLDDQGNLQIKVGDRVYAWGKLDIDSAEASELMAQGVVALRPDRTKGKQAPGSA